MIEVEPRYNAGGPCGVTLRMCCSWDCDTRAETSMYHLLHDFLSFELRLLVKILFLRIQMKVSLYATSTTACERELLSRLRFRGTLCSVRHKNDSNWADTQYSAASYYTCTSNITDYDIFYYRKNRLKLLVIHESDNNTHHPHFKPGQDRKARVLWILSLNWVVTTIQRFLPRYSSLCRPPTNFEK